MKTYISVDRYAIERNRKRGIEPIPVLVVESGDRAVAAHGAEILGPSRIVYSPGRPRLCGAIVWIETEGEVIPTLPGT